MKHEPSQGRQREPVKTNVLNVTTDQIAEALIKAVRQELDRWNAQTDERKWKDEVRRHNQETQDRLRARLRARLDGEGDGA